MIRQTVTIQNKLGLHARAAARLVRLTSSYRSEIKLGREGHREQIDGKSILGILLLAAARGTQLRIAVSGEDEKEAMEAIIGLISDGFGEAR